MNVAVQPGPVTAGTLRHDIARRIGADEARQLVSLMLDVQPIELMRNGDRMIEPDMVARILAATARRARGEPLAYCAGRAAFRHLVLEVDARVLIPRPETEVLVGEVLALCTSAGGVAIDIGTGSGAIALSLATEGQFDRIIATDVSADALAVARMNAARLRVESTPVEFRCGAGYAPLAGERARVLVSNPPYIAYEEAADLPRSVRDWEPPTALYADHAGQAMYEALLAGAKRHVEPGGWVVLEVDSRRALDTKALALRTGSFDEVRLIRDLTGRERVLVAHVSENADELTVHN